MNKIKQVVVPPKGSIAYQLGIINGRISTRETLGETTNNAYSALIAERKRLEKLNSEEINNSRS